MNDATYKATHGRWVNSVTAASFEAACEHAAAVWGAELISVSPRESLRLDRRGSRLRQAAESIRARCERLGFEVELDSSRSSDSHYLTVTRGDDSIRRF